MKSIEEATTYLAFLQLRIAISLQLLGVERAAGVSKKLVGFFHLQVVHFGVVEVHRLGRVFNYEAFWKAMAGSFAYKHTDDVRSDIATQLWMMSYRSYKKAEKYLGQGDALNAIVSAKKALMYYPGAVSSQEIIEEARSMLKNPDRIAALLFVKKARILADDSPMESLMFLDRAITLYPSFQGVRRFHSELSLKEAHAAIVKFDYEGAVSLLEKAILLAGARSKPVDKKIALELEGLKETAQSLMDRRDKANRLLAEAQEADMPVGDALVKALLSQRISPCGGSLQSEMVLRLTASHGYSADTLARAHFSVEMCLESGFW